MGGAPQQDMWDMKPGAPSEYRGIFKPIPIRNESATFIIGKFGTPKNLTGNTKNSFRAL